MPAFMAWVIIFGLSLFVAVYLGVRLLLEHRKDDAPGAGKRYAADLELFEQVSPFVAALRPGASAYLSAMSSKDIGELERSLRDAGLRETISMEEFIGLRMLAGIFGFFVGLILLIMSGMQPLALLAVFMLGLIGWVYPNMWLTNRAQQRQGRIFRGLSDTLDVLAVSVAAGLEVREALERVVHIGSEPLLDREIERTLQEIDKGGKSLEQGFQDLAERVSLAEMTAFVNAILMAFRLGASGMGDLLSEQADAIRRERIVRAERQANQMGSKILFPIAIFIFPAVIVTLLGPMALEAYLAFGR